MSNLTPNSSPSEVATRPQGGSLLDSAFQQIPAEQRQRLLEKAFEKKLELDVKAFEAAQKHERSSADMQNTVRHVNDIERSTKSDYTVKANFETASGHTSVEIKKSNNTTTIIVAVVVAVIFLIFISK